MQKKTGFFLIADISGYTPFIKNHSMRKKPLIGKKIADFWDSHADKLINTLLEEANAIAPPEPPSPIIIDNVGTVSCIEHSIDFAIASACHISSATTPG